MSLALPFSSNRSFLVHSYKCSHGLLLLRSKRTDNVATRQDILFTDVRATEMRFWFDGITIGDADSSILADCKSKPTEMIEHGIRVYVLKGSDWTGFIVGGSVHFHEDEKQYNEPSALFGSD